MSASRLAAQGANAKTPAKLPALQASRAADPDVRKSLENVREWIEVRLGSRGDPFEKAVTKRELDQALAPLETAIAQLEAQAMVAVVDVLPPLKQGDSVQMGDDLYYCNGKAWKLVTLT